MQNQIPYKSLTIQNWIVAFMSSVLIAVFLVASTHDFSGVALRFVQTFLFMGMTGFCNLALLYLFKAEKQNFDKYFRLKFYPASYLCTVLIWLLVRSLYAVVTGLRWEGEGPNVQQAYVMAILAIWILNTLIIILQNLVILQHKKTQTEIENLQLKANRSETANLLLRQQIHPHFLFNALNTVKSLYKNDFKQGEAYLVHLANFLRVSVSNQTTKTTLIKNELEFCLDYLKMQSIRFGSAMDYTIDLSQETIENGYLPFFSLQPLLENALKHNSLTEEFPILITIKEESGYVLVSNNLQPMNYKEASTGHGLFNLAERYRLLAEEAITISAERSFFTVKIKILTQ